jgi:hypothetical protein
MPGGFQYESLLAFCFLNHIALSNLIVAYLEAICQENSEFWVSENRKI